MFFLKNYNGWIIYNGNLNQSKFNDQVAHFNKIAASKGIELQMIKNNELFIAIKNGKSLIKGKYEGIFPDFVLFWDKDIALAKHLEKMGMHLYNSSDAIAICDDKGLTYEVLSNNGIKMPDTIIAPKVFIEVNDFSVYDSVIEFLGFPMVIKECFGSFGAQVYMIKSSQELVGKIKELENKTYVFQRFVKSSYGRDVRINVVDGQVVAAMLRTSENDFRANISAGGKMEKYIPSEAEKNMAVRCCDIIGASFAGVDLLFGEDNEPILCEINSNAHMKNIYDCTGIDVADYIIDFIFKEVKIQNE